ncbi:MAG: hypothetical protein WC389_20345 [Lutibacter sp.]|jgi:23S rRNA (adenine2503-C2)-methyltransferase
MKILQNIKVPTGNILILQGDNGKIECLSIGDYGKEKNIKADFLGITKEINGVPNGDIMPLSEKWVITISTQYGCSMNCKFCDVPMVGKGKNATLFDLRNQVELALSLHPEITETKRLNIHYARMGEPTFNWLVLSHAINLKWSLKERMGNSLIHPVVSTMMPKNNKKLYEFLGLWTSIKNLNFNGDAGLQLSINSTNDDQREEMFSGNSMTLKEISNIMAHLYDPEGRKWTLNFALADDYEIDSEYLKSLFPTHRFMCKITPLHKTKSCDENGIKTTGGYNEYTPYKKIESELKAVGFDVIVFVPSIEEDESMITCGNAILAHKKDW